MSRHHAWRAPLAVGMTLMAAPALAAGPLSFVADSAESRGGAAAVDGDRTTAWIGLATPRRPAWISLRLREPARVTGVELYAPRMPSNTFLSINVSEDGEQWTKVVSDSRHMTEGKELHAFDAPHMARFVRLTFENASRQPTVPFPVYEVVPVTDPPHALDVASASATQAIAVPAPSPTPSLRVLGAVYGHWEGKPVLLVVGDRFASPIQEVRAGDHVLRVLSATPTQILCQYPYPHPWRLDVVVKAAGHAAKRTVATVSREIRWPPLSSPTPSP